MWNDSRHLNFRALIGLLMALPSAVYVGMWIAARDFEERLMWDGIPSVAIIQHFHDVSEMRMLVVLCGAVLGVTLLFLAPRAWQIAGIAIPLIGVTTIYLVFAGLRAALSSHGEYLVHGNEELASGALFLSFGLVLLPLMLAAVMRWLFLHPRAQSVI